MNKLLFLAVVAMLLATSHCAPMSADAPEVLMERSSRQKREIYVTVQDRSQAVCIGLCMYHNSRSYFKCQKNCRIGIPRARQAVLP